MQICGKRCNFFELKKGSLPTRYLKQNSKSVPTRQTLLFDEIGSVPTRRSNANLKIRKFAP